MTGKEKDKNFEEESAEVLCEECGSVMVYEDGELICPHCDGDIDYFGDDDDEELSDEV